MAVQEEKNLNNPTLILFSTRWERKKCWQLFKDIIAPCNHRVAFLECLMSWSVSVEGLASILLIKATYLLLMRGGERRHIGGGSNILLGGVKRLGIGLGRGAKTAVAVISCPSIWPVCITEERISSAVATKPLYFLTSPHFLIPPASNASWRLFL